MLRNPRKHRYPMFAGQRVHAAGAIVELVKRKPVRVVQMSFDVLTFDRDGYFDTEVFDRHQFSRFAGPGSTTEITSGVLDARNRFADRGGRWAPSKSLMRALREALLGHTKVPRI